MKSPRSSTTKSSQNSPEFTPKLGKLFELIEDDNMKTRNDAISKLNGSEENDNHKSQNGHDNKIKEKVDVNSNYRMEKTTKSSPKDSLKNDKIRLNNDDNKDEQDDNNKNGEKDKHNRNRVGVHKNNNISDDKGNHSKINSGYNSPTNKRIQTDKITDNNKLKIKNSQTAIQNEPLNNNKIKNKTLIPDTKTNINANPNKKKEELKEDENVKALTNCEEYCGVGSQCPDPCPPPFEKIGEGKRELIGHESFNMNTIDAYRVKYGLESDHMKRVNPCDWIVNNANLTTVEPERTERIQSLIDQVLIESQPRRNNKGQLIAPSCMAWI